MGNRPTNCDTNTSAFTVANNVLSQKAAPYIYFTQNTIILERNFYKIIKLDYLHKSTQLLYLWNTRDISLYGLGYEMQ